MKNIRQILPAFFSLFLISAIHAQSESALRSDSFGVFSSPYDRYSDPLYWHDDQQPQFSLFNGIHKNYLNIGAAASYSGLYGAFNYVEKITDYKDWPQNMT